MADEILNCDGTDPVHIPDWDNVIGDKTLENGGYFSDLLEITRAHLEDAKERGELTEEASGVAYGQAIMDSMKQAIEFELQEGKSKLELCFLQAQIDKIASDIANETCLATAQCALLTEQTESEAMQNMADGVLENQILKLQAETALVVEQDNEIPKESARRDCTTNSQCAVNDAQIEKLLCDCTNDTNMTDSKISLNAAQENKLACECCNDSKRTEGQIVKWECDCANSSRVTNAQAELYERQVAGFTDNANQKIYDTQMNAWAMVFADQEDLGVLDASINEESIDLSYTRIQNRLSAAAAKESEEL